MHKACADWVMWGLSHTFAYQEFRKMEKKETDRLLEEAIILIDSSTLPSEEKENLKCNIRHFLSSVSKDSYVKGCTWSWFDYGEDGHGLDLNWDWEDVSGVFGFYADNGHGFSFDYGKDGKAFMFGGEDGEHGFFCGIFLDDFEATLAHMGY